LKWILKDVYEDVDWFHLAEDRAVIASCECNNKLSVSVKVGEFLDWLSDC
jgi:hypothetical protein